MTEVPVYLDPFAAVSAIGARQAVLAVFTFDDTASGQARMTVRVLDGTGRLKEEMNGIGDLCPWPGGGVAGVRLTSTGNALTVFLQAEPGLPPLPMVETAALSRLSRVRLWPGDDGWVVLTGLDGDTVVVRAGKLAAGGTLPLQPVPPLVSDPDSGRTIGSLIGPAGMVMADGRLFIGLQTTELPAAEGWAPLGVETRDLGQTCRVVEAPPDQGNGPVVWRTSAVATWGAQVWVATTRTCEGDQSHRIYRFVPGAAPGPGLEIGGVVDGLPWGLMVQAAEPGGAPAPLARFGGMWSGDRLVIGAVPAALDTPAGRLTAPGSAGVYLGTDGDTLRFQPLPDGLWLAGALCLGDPAGPPQSAPWLCRLMDAEGRARLAQTTDFIAWALDPDGSDLVPAHVATLARWGRLA